MCLSAEASRRVSTRVTVGTTITDRPPHRPVLAALPHTVPTSDVWRRSEQSGRDAVHGPRVAGCPTGPQSAPMYILSAGCAAVAASARVSEHHCETPSFVPSYPE